MSEIKNFERMYRKTPVSRRRILQILRGVTLAASTIGVLSKSSRQAPVETAPPALAAPVETGPAAANIKKARNMLAEAGIGYSFTASNPEALYKAAVKVAQRENLASSIWKTFHSSPNQVLGLTLNHTGEAVPLRSGPDGKPTPIADLDFELKDKDQPVVSYEKTDSTPDGGKKIVVVTYPSNLDTHARTDKFFSENRTQLDQLIGILFTHSQASLNILHLADDGMPTQVFHHPDFSGEANGFIDDDLPSAGVRADSILRYDIKSGKTTRADIFLSLKAIKQEAAVLGLPIPAVMAGVMANKAYDCSQETYRVSHSLPPIPGRSKAASTGADWGVRMLASHNSPNPFFNSEVMEFIGKLAVPRAAVAAT